MRLRFAAAFRFGLLARLASLLLGLWLRLRLAPLRFQISAFRIWTVWTAPGQGQVRLKLKEAAVGPAYLLLGVAINEVRRHRSALPALPEEGQSLVRRKMKVQGLYPRPDLGIVTEVPLHPVPRLF